MGLGAVGVVACVEGVKVGVRVGVTEGLVHLGGAVEQHSESGCATHGARRLGHDVEAVAPAGARGAVRSSARSHARGESSRHAHAPETQSRSLVLLSWGDEELGRMGMVCLERTGAERHGGRRRRR